ncbi:3-phosphoshikimate 1-carboxyvinyltransferase [Candidatus Woesearchaeota archaeon]|nr:3-phosphoshikimate 1-carboxyvinyltransferase [Candidatus Woesearchaeota archaeon]
MQKIEIIPLTDKIDSKLVIPGSKSYSNRALIISSLAKGKSVLKNVLFSEDIDYLINSLKQFGIFIEKRDNVLAVNGTGGTLKKPKKELFLGGSGTGIRLLASFASLCKGEVILTGESRLKQRPIQDLINGLNQLGVNAVSIGNNGCPPVKIQGGTFAGGSCGMNGKVSSQYFTSIMLIAPYAKKDVRIKVISELASKPYIDITMTIMKEFGVNVENNDYKEFFIKSGQEYTAGEYLIEGDASSASYFFAIAAITNSRIIVRNINPCSLQGDIKFADILERMGCNVIKKENEIEITGTGDLKAIEIDMNKMPDTVPTLAVMAAFSKGITKIKNIANLRLKESDRISAIGTELNKLGIKTEESEDSLTIYGGNPHGNVELETYNDHRIAMAFSLVGLKLPGIKILHPACVNKSFPGFWNKLKELGAGLNYA